MWIVHFLLPILPRPMFCVGDLVTRAPAKGLTTGSLLQEVDLTPTAPWEQRQGLDLSLLASRSWNFIFLGGRHLNPLPGSGQDLAVQDTTVVADITPGHNLPNYAGEPHTVHTCWTENFVFLFALAHLQLNFDRSGQPIAWFPEPYPTFCCYCSMYLGLFYPHYSCECSHTYTHTL